MIKLSKLTGSVETLRDTMKKTNTPRKYTIKDVYDDTLPTTQCSKKTKVYDPYGKGCDEGPTFGEMVDYNLATIDNISTITIDVERNTIITNYYE